MISNNILQELSEGKGIDKYSILREIIQIQFLNELYKNKDSKHLFFKGGTALKIIFGSNRYSEDLDFTTNLTLKKLNILIDKAIVELKKEYPDVYLKDLDTIQGISKKIILPVDISSQPLTIKLDFSKRENVLDPKLGTIFTNLPITTTSIINHLSLEEILAEKYRAIINRQKGRDLYDFLFILKKNVKFNIKLINNKLKFYNEKYNPEEFIEKVKKWNNKDLDNDIRKFLPLKDRSIIPEIKNLILAKFDEVK
ncbi:MAG: hypothetical protein UR39_C0002G0032 [Candidatus Woesebacteria bacterium GW2011_GWA1_33_30]|uniref:Abortive infection protein AbiGII n=1 Tax=Candidatus Woesebacteria bacterium GW2011_GWA2_33_28 TaxID=1618561 RepID=A0A0F9ZUJ9_9BACT|nr:MAG: hypothetical protein UR38_C0002G0032 [Candidatus Woesebacteria bacterium GW2011_GWA2_33_28]KKP48742.1 MAG: hypothetical protein UR39_C0002G0032 [Candidatus Woesebacteria bacterium GW2011_GWA1_33_30]KKP50015.1 MAG: hypothetical protein UR40_C0002G0032 [Microgenomates group bacterium GW2011_GWC1_33_32]KKP51786.1 MAG: hypothetical protein UR44_C0006G0032 [Candidatus Woesebacteria bacterium GW2011_GWB1_33_38]KKP58600.1 MAG: hypothetical protein UR48_C0003G0027 [Microgenomates group bacteriu